MRPGPAAAAELLPSILDVSSPPRPAQAWLADIALAQGWASNRAAATELSERWSQRFLVRLRQNMSALHERGRACYYDFNSSSEYMVQGSAFVEPGVDSADLRIAKEARRHLRSYVDELQGLKPSEFEVLCRGMLTILGVKAPALTPATADQGIDFYGLLPLGSLLKPNALPGLHTILNVWLIGQAKHYTAGHAATPEIRELVGSVGLAQAQAFGRPDSPYPQLKVRLCDPVFYLFFTTGRISAPGWQLLDSSGVVGMDGEMVGAFLADNGVGMVDGEFSPDAFQSWLSQHA